ncbi:hypothetical protein [Azospirillum doebereinerae]
MTNAGQTTPQTGPQTGPQTTPKTGTGQVVPDLGDDLPGPENLRKLTEEHETALFREAQERTKKKQNEQDAIRDAFMNQHIRPDAKERFTRAVSNAASAGLKQIQVVRFPSKFCSDGGRAINNFDPDWPDSLTGYAREAYEVYDKSLRQKGYRLHAEILDYPDGMLGDVGLFLSW